MQITGTTRQEAGEAADSLNRLKKSVDPDTLSFREWGRIEMVVQALRTFERGGNTDVDVTPASPAVAPRKGAQRRAIRSAS